MNDFKPVRRRVRAKVMAEELGISERKFWEIKALGLPYTEVQGIIWFEPDRVHAWLDRFARTGRRGIKGQRNSGKAALQPEQEVA